MRLASLPKQFNLLRDLLDRSIGYAQRSLDGDLDDLACDDTSRSLLVVHTLAVFRSFVLKVMHEDQNKLTLQGTQVASCVDAWTSCFEARLFRRKEVGSIQPPADELEVAATSGRLGAGGKENV